MNVLIVSYHNYKKDGVLNELAKVFPKTDTVIFVTPTESNAICHAGRIVTKLHTLVGYLKFIRLGIKTGKSLCPIDILYLDSSEVSYAGSILMKLLNPVMSVYFSRELYADRKMPLLGGMLYKKETVLYKKVDLVIACNDARSKKMVQLFELQSQPYVFNNIRRLSASYDTDSLKKKYAQLFCGEIKFISTGGCFLERGTLNLVKAFSQFPSYSLYIVGNTDTEDFAIVRNYLDDHNIDNVVLLESVGLGELRYLIQQCDIGIVEYSQEGFNNMYCASGKIYEYLFEGLPVLTTENIPLVELCKKYQIGVSDNSFAKGIEMLSANLEYYKENVRSFQMEKIDNQNNSLFYDKIVTKFHECNDKSRKR